MCRSSFSDTAREQKLQIEQVIVDTDEITHRQKLLNSYFGVASQVSGSDQLCGVSARQTAKVMLSAIRSQFSESDDDKRIRYKQEW